VSLSCFFYHFLLPQVASPLSEEIEAEVKRKQAEKKRAQKAAKREKEKTAREEEKRRQEENERKLEEQSEKERFLALSDREKVSNVCILISAFWNFVNFLKSYEVLL